MTQHTQHRGASARGGDSAPADARGIDEPLATIRRSDVEEVRITWSTYRGNPYVGVRLWGKDRAGKWWPDPKRGLSIRLAELAEARDAIGEAIRLADEYYRARDNSRQLRQDRPRPQNARPRHVQTERGHGPYKPPNDRPSWKDAALPRAEPAQPSLPFNEFD